MSSAKARTVRSLVTVILAASAVGFSSFVYAESADKPRGRDRETRDSKQTQVVRPESRVAVPATPEARPTQPARAAQPVYQGRAAQPIPQARPDQGRRASGQQQRALPVDQGGLGQVSPQPARNNRGWQRQQQATPEREYRTPEQRTAPETPRQLQRPTPQGRTTAQPRRVDTGRPDWGNDRVAEPRLPPTQQDRPKAQPWRGLPEQSRERPQSPRDGQSRVAPAPSNKGRLHTVPEASFRGPDADRNVRIGQPAERKRVPQLLRDRLQQQNHQTLLQTPGRPKVDFVGNPISGDVSILLRDKANRVKASYRHVKQACGEPSHFYVFGPRNRSDYWDGYWDGFGDGYDAARRHHHGRHIAVSFYYGYYWSDPLWFAFYYPGYYPAVYSYWGWAPAWVYPERCYYAPAEYVYAPATPYRYYGTDYRVDERGAESALNDIRRAWYDSDISTFAYHLSDDVDIRVYFDGEYSYSTTTQDYYAMTADAMATTQTTSLTFDDPIWLSSNEFFVTGRHVFYDPNDEEQRVYVSYRLRKLGGEWYVVSVGSSLDPIQHQYHDFRY